MSLRAVWPSRARWRDPQLRDKATGSQEPYWILLLGVFLALELVVSLGLCIDDTGPLYDSFFRVMTVVPTRTTVETRALSLFRVSTARIAP